MRPLYFDESFYLFFFLTGVSQTAENRLPRNFPTRRDYSRPFLASFPRHNEILVENRKFFGTPHLCGTPVEGDTVEISQSGLIYLANKLVMGSPGDEKV